VTTAQNLALDATHVYWTDASSAVLRVPLTGGSVQTIAQGQATPYGLAVAAGYVYWSNNLGAAIMRAPSDGSGSPQTVASASQPYDIAVHQGSVYWIDGSDAHVWTAPAAGGTPTIAATPTSHGGSGTNTRLIESPAGPIVNSYSSPFWFVTSVLGGWSVQTGSGTAAATRDIAQDGVNVYYGGSTCGVGGVALAGGQNEGCELNSRFPSGFEPLAADACGIVYSGTPAFDVSLALHGVTYGVPLLLGAGADAAVVGGGFVYFHSTADSAIGKLALP
jgi:hypothetical protein